MSNIIAHSWIESKKTGVKGKLQMLNFFDHATQIASIFILLILHHTYHFFVVTFKDHSPEIVVNRAKASPDPDFVKANSGS